MLVIGDCPRISHPVRPTFDQELMPFDACRTCYGSGNRADLTTESVSLRCQPQGTGAYVSFRHEGPLRHRSSQGPRARNRCRFGVALGGN